MTKDVNPMVGNCKYSKIIALEIRKHFGEPESLIELGCGRGGNLAEFPEATPLVGIDPLSDNVEVARKLNLRADMVVDIIMGDHFSLSNYMLNQFDIGFTCSVLDHIERFEQALKSMCLICRNIMLFEPITMGESRRAFERETSCWETTWYHNYHFVLGRMGLEFKCHPYQLYSTNSGPRFHQFIIKTENYDAKMD
jgi:SAM-dependent methyltransferase